MGGDIQGTDKNGRNGAGPWDSVQNGGTDCATIWGLELGDDGRDAEGDGGVIPQSGPEERRNDRSEGGGRRVGILPSG